MASKPKPALSEWLIAHRKERGETVEDIARVTDRSAVTVRGWEAGRPPKADDPVIAHLERHFGAVAPRETGADPGMSRLAAAIEEQNELLRKVIGLWVLGEEMRSPTVLEELRAFVTANLPGDPKPSRLPISNHGR